MLVRLDARGNQFLRVFVAQFVEENSQRRAMADGLVQHLLRVKLEEAVDGAQVALAVRLRGGAEFRHRRLVRDRGDEVLQGLALRDVHVDVVAGNDGEGRGASPG